MFHGQLVVLTVFSCVLLISCRESCILKSGEDGECVDIGECPSAIGLLQKRILPESCGFNGRRPIVCCVDKKKSKHGENIYYVEGNVYCALGFPYIKTKGFGIGGEDSLAMEFPHMAALGFEDGNETVWACGGTLISKRHILTAAHCLQSRNLGEVKFVRLGDLNLRSEKDDALPQNFLIVNRTKHPEYKPPSQYNDIAIIELDREAQLNFYVTPACLNSDREIKKTTFYATGWGRIGYDGQLADHLQKMTIKLVPNKECSKGYNKVTKRRLAGGIMDDLQICAGAPKIDTCPGDSGGPLQINTYRGAVVYGVTSLGIACGISTTPGIYTRVSNYITWIRSVVS